MKKLSESVKTNFWPKFSKIIFNHNLMHPSKGPSIIDVDTEGEGGGIKKRLLHQALGLHELILH